MIRVFMLLSQLFMLWMLWDAIQRRTEYYWYIIIILPLGEWFYFFIVKIHDPEMKGLKETLTFPRKRPATLDQLRYRAGQTPSLENKITLGQALFDHEQYRESVSLFTEVLKRDPRHFDALLGLGLCRLERGEYGEAIATFRELIELERGALDYQPWSHLAKAYWAKGDRDGAVQTLRELVGTSPRLGHRLALAHVLGETGDPGGARETLTEGLEEHRHAPRFLQRENRALARQAKKMLEQLP